jgi:hypothetical protein
MAIWNDEKLQGICMGGETETERKLARFLLDTRTVGKSAGDEISRLRAERDNALGRAQDAEMKLAVSDTKWQQLVIDARETRDKADLEVERLRAEIRQWIEHVEKVLPHWREGNGPPWVLIEIEISRLRALNARLVGALKDVANDTHFEYERICQRNGIGDYSTGVFDGYKCAANKAKQALNGIVAEKEGL